MWVCCYMTRSKLALLAVGVIGALAVIALFAVPAILGFDSEGPPRLAIRDRAEESIALAVGREDGAQPADLEAGERSSKSATTELSASKTPTAPGYSPVTRWPDTEYSKSSSGSTSSKPWDEPSRSSAIYTSTGT